MYHVIIQLEINPYIGAITVNGNIYFYGNYGGGGAFNAKVPPGMSKRVTHNLQC